LIAFLNVLITHRHVNIFLIYKFKVLESQKTKAFKNNV
jgi:hypothetical protein